MYSIYKILAHWFQDYPDTYGTWLKTKASKKKMYDILFRGRNQTFLRLRLRNKPLKKERKTIGYLWHLTNACISD